MTEQEVKKQLKLGKTIYSGAYMIYQCDNKSVHLTCDAQCCDEYYETFEDFWDSFYLHKWELK